MKPLEQLIVAAFAAAALLPFAAMSQDTRNQGYLIEARSDIVMSGSGLCWRVFDWTPARTVAPCGPVQQQVALAAPAPAPAGVVTTPAAQTAPLPRPVLAQAGPQRVNLSGDALFGFDRYELRPEGKAMLDDLVRQFEGVQFDSSTVVGHTDRFGAQAYNQALSERRADVVKAYLVSRQVSAGRVDARGMGKSRPTTAAGDCRGAKSAAVIACLQPDRRVEVEMNGSRTVTGSLSSRDRPASQRPSRNSHTQR